MYATYFLTSLVDNYVRKVDNCGRNCGGASRKEPTKGKVHRGVPCPFAVYSINNGDGNMEKGIFYWISGLSGAGKTTIGTMFYNYLKEKKDNVVLIDGDVLREITGDSDFSEVGRDNRVKKNARLFALLTDQGIDVVNCSIGLRNKYREWNRELISNISEIYIKVSMDELIRRDPKGLYRRALNKETSNVYGVDLPYDEPENPAVVVVNEGDTTPEDALRQIIDALGV